ncbi:MAG: YcbK family protein [Vicinamibacteria bacterium]
MSRAFLRASLALWTRRLKYFRRKHNFYHRFSKRPEAERKALARKWHEHEDRAAYWVVRRRRELDDYASANFRMSEFNTHDGTPVPTAAHGGVRNLCRLILEPMRKQFGACHVTSGYRHSAYNAKVGGAAKSYHIYDLRPDEPAADVSFACGTPAEWAAFARKLGRGGVGQYDRSGFVHVDLGPRRNWSG